MAVTVKWSSIHYQLQDYNYQSTRTSHFSCKNKQHLEGNVKSNITCKSIARQQTNINIVEKLVENVNNWQNLCVMNLETAVCQSGTTYSDMARHIPPTYKYHSEIKICNNIHIKLNTFHYTCTMWAKTDGFSRAVTTTKSPVQYTLLHFMQANFMP